MHNGTALATSEPEDRSPFDAIRRTRPDGSEYWSARDLVEPLGYSQWRDFDSAVNRAKIACANSGNDVTSNFADARKINKSSPAGQDWELSRFACYLVAMNGDPRKPEISAAQVYFAVKTREAETRRELTRRELLVMALEAEDRAELWEQRAITKRDEARALTARVEADAPKVDAYHQLLDADGLYSLATAAQVVGMGREKFISELARLGLIIVRPGHSDHLRPYQTQIKAGRFVVKVRVFDVVKDGQEETRTEGTTRLTPKGLTHVRQLLARPTVEPIDATGQRRII